MKASMNKSKRIDSCPTRVATLAQRRSRLLATSASLAIVFSGAGTANAATIGCDAFVADYVSWAKAKIGTNRVGAKAATVKIRESNPTRYPWGHGSYAEGGFGLHGNDLQGRFVTLFSDRKTPGGKYRFDPNRSDIQDVTLLADGRAQVVLRSWGDASFFLQSMSCSDEGFFTGVMHEANGRSLLSFVLRKEIIPVGKDEFRNWP